MTQDEVNDLMARAFERTRVLGIELQGQLIREFKVGVGTPDEKRTLTVMAGVGAAFEKMGTELIATAVGEAYHVR